MPQPSLNSLDPKPNCNKNDSRGHDTNPQPVRHGTAHERLIRHADTHEDDGKITEGSRQQGLLAKIEMNDTSTCSPPDSASCAHRCSFLSPPSPVSLSDSRRDFVTLTRGGQRDLHPPPRIDGNEIRGTNGRMKSTDSASGLRNRNWRSRMATLERLDHHATKQDESALVKALADRSPRVRRLAAHAIGCQRCKAGPLSVDVIGLLGKLARRDASLRVRRVALHLLGTQPRSLRVRKVLQAALRRETALKTRFVIAWGLSRHSGDR